MKSKFLILNFVLLVTEVSQCFQNSKDSKKYWPLELDFGNADDVMTGLIYLNNSIPNDLYSLRKLQMKEFKSNRVYKTAWDIAKTKYSGIKKYLLEKYPDSAEQVFKVPKALHLALIAYTLNKPGLYHEFNQRTRLLLGSKISMDEYNYKSMFRLLELARLDLGGLLKPVVPRPGEVKEKFIPKPTKLYRGLRNKIRFKEGQVITFPYFISTTIYKEFAIKEFALSDIVFEFEGGIEEN